MAELDPWLRWLLVMNLWTAALLAVAVALDVALARRVRPAWRIALYATVAARLAMPVDWHSPLGALGGADVGAIATTDLLAPDEPVLLGAATPIGDAATSPALASASALPVRWAHALLGSLWSSVTLALLAGLVLARRRLARALQTAVPARDRVALRMPGIVVCEHDSLGPLTFGALRPRVVLPCTLIDTLDDDALGHVLAHERAHVQRHDGLLVAVIAVTCAVLWPVVPLWIVSVRVRALVERAADELALADASLDTRLAFGRTLLRLAGAAAPPSAALALGGYRDLRGRIQALRVDAQLPRFAQLVTLGSAIAIPLACAGHAEPSGTDRSRCAELQREATRAHDRFEAGETEQAPVAIAAYDAFAEQCADAAELTDLLYYRAELYWALAHASERRGDDASDAFAQAHEAFLDALDAGTERFETDAATAQMLAKRAELGLATTTVVDADPEAKPVVREGSIHEERRTDYDADEVELLASYTRFEAHVDDPANAELQQVLLHRASLAMRHARWDDARVAAERLLAGSDGGLVHVRAAEILVDLHTIAATDPAASAATTASATDALVQLCERLPTMALWKHPEAMRLREAVPTLQAGMRWRTADRHAASGNPTACGELFEALAREHPEHPRHDAMLRNGMTCFQDGGDHTHAAALARQLLDAHPGSEHAAHARALLDAR